MAYCNRITSCIFSKRGGRILVVHIDSRVTSHDIKQWSVIRLAFYLILCLDRAPIIEEILRKVKFGCCESYQMAASVLMIVTSVQLVNNSFFVEERPVTFKNKGARTKRFTYEEDRFSQSRLSVLLFAASGSVLFLTHSHHIGITVRQVILTDLQ